MFTDEQLSTVFLTAGAVFVALLLGMVVIARQRETYRGFVEWTLASFCIAFGVVLIGLRGRVPVLLSVILANCSVMGSLVLIHAGLSRFMDRTTLRFGYLVPFAALLLPYLELTYLHPDLRARIVLSSALYVACCIVIIIFYLRVVLPRYRSNWLAPVGFSMLIVLFLGDIVFSLRRIPSGPGNFMQSGATEAVIVIAAFSAVILIIMGLVVLNSQRTENELRTAMAEIKTLRGIVPICASCKRVRDDAGYWSAVESYVQEHTEAQFSHGLCPDCRNRLYPEFGEPNSDTAGP